MWQKEIEELSGDCTHDDENEEKAASGINCYNLT